VHAESAVHVAWQLVWGFAEVVLLVNEPWLLALSTHAPLPTSVYEVPALIAGALRTNVNEVIFLASWFMATEVNRS